MNRQRTTLLQHFITCITKKYFTFSGRSSRVEYLGFLFIGLTIIFGPIIVSKLITIPNNILSVMFDFTLSSFCLLMIPFLTASVRRFRDINRPGFLAIIFTVFIFHRDVLIYLSRGGPFDIYLISIPDLYKLYGESYRMILIPFSILYFFFVLQKGDEGSNKYGPDPLDSVLGNEISQIGRD